MDKQLLQIRLSIIMKKEGLNFLHSLQDYQVKLKKYFSFEYSLDEIESALFQMEENHIVEESKQNGIINIPEDYSF